MGNDNKPIHAMINNTCRAMAQDVIWSWEHDTPEQMKERGNDTIENIQDEIDRLEIMRGDLEYYDKIHEEVDQSEWVIYFHKAHQVCQNMGLDYAEQQIKDVGPPSDLSYDGFAVALAYWCLYGLVADQVEQLIEETLETLDDMLDTLVS